MISQQECDPRERSIIWKINQRRIFSEFDRSINSAIQNTVYSILTSFIFIILSRVVHSFSSGIMFKFFTLSISLSLFSLVVNVSGLYEVTQVGYCSLRAGTFYNPLMFRCESCKNILSLLLLLLKCSQSLNLSLSLSLLSRS